MQENLAFLTTSLSKVFVIADVIILAFFGTEGEDFNTFSLIDRINLHFKVGASAMMPFSIEEQVFVARTDTAETFEEVLQIVVDVYEFSKQEKVEDVPPAAQQGESESNDDEQSEQQTE